MALIFCGNVAAEHNTAQRNCSKTKVRTGCSFGAEDLEKLRALFWTYECYCWSIYQIYNLKNIHRWKFKGENWLNMITSYLNPTEDKQQKYDVLPVFPLIYHLCVSCNLQPVYCKYAPFTHQPPLYLNRPVWDHSVAESSAVPCPFFLFKFSVNWRKSWTVLSQLHASTPYQAMKALTCSWTPKSALFIYWLAGLLTCCQLVQYMHTVIKMQSIYRPLQTRAGAKMSFSGTEVAVQMKKL